MTALLENMEGIVLHAKPAAFGGRSVRIFTKERGQEVFFAARGIIGRCGTGLLLPFTQLRLTAARDGRRFVLRQYEGRAFFNILDLSYEELQAWYYLIELIIRFFPAGGRDARLYTLLLSAGKTAREKNKELTAFIAAIQALELAGYSPVGEEPIQTLALGKNAATLLRIFARYVWGQPLDMAVKGKDFYETAGYLNRFLEYYCDTELQTKDAFLPGNRKGQT